MTEKHYGGGSSFGFKENISKNVPKEKKYIKDNSSTKKETKSQIDFGKLMRAGEIAKKTKEFARQNIKKGTLLHEIAEKIESKIIELSGKPAFPVNLSINEIAAHATPSHDDKSLASGLLKVDLGVHIDGYTADTAFSFDFENSHENEKLIKSVEESLKKAIEKIDLNIPLREIGKTIEKEINSFGFKPVTNLSGHSISQYELHAGVTIPNHDNFQETKLEDGIYAIEPFATTGAGKVINGKPSGIYHFENNLPVRDSFAREVLEYIKDEYSTLPFCSRWLVKKFGTRALLALKRLEEARILHHYPQLIEQNRKPVAQAEHTIILTRKEKIVTT